MPLIDSIIGATARTRGLVVVTRNVGDFEPAGLNLVNPFPASDTPDAAQEPAST